jgi:hypothetical protein
MVITFVMSNKQNYMNNDERKELLKNIQMMKMQIKSELEKLRFSMENGIYVDKEVDILLDRLRNLENIEKEIEKKK